MSNKSKFIGWLVAFILGLGANQVYSATSGKYVEILPTKSGTFVVQKGRIFQLDELMPEVIFPANGGN